MNIHDNSLNATEMGKNNVAKQKKLNSRFSIIS